MALKMTAVVDHPIIVAVVEPMDRAGRHMLAGVRKAEGEAEVDLQILGDTRRFVSIFRMATTVKMEVVVKNDMMLRNAMRELTFLKSG